MAKNEYVDPFNYWERRSDKKNIGKIVYIRERDEKGTPFTLPDPYVLIAKMDGKLIAVRLEDQMPKQRIVWKEAQHWSIPGTYLIEAVVKNEIFKNKLDIPVMDLEVKTYDLVREFKVDLATQYIVKPDPSFKGTGDLELYIDDYVFNSIIHRYVSFGPTSALAEEYSFTNWEDGK